MRAYSYVELETQPGESKTLIDNLLFENWEKAIKFLHDRYLSIREKVDAGEGEFDADYSEDGFFVIVGNDDSIHEGYVSEALEIL